MCGLQLATLSCFQMPPMFIHSHLLQLQFEIAAERFAELNTVLLCGQM